MEVCIAYMHGEPVILELRDGHVFIDGEIQPIKHLDESDLKAFGDAIRAIPYSTDPGYAALVNARRAAFLADLLGKAVGDECVSLLSHILDHVHYEVLDYLGETGEDG